MSHVEQKPLTIVIVGGVAGGASAATRARRLNEHAQIILLEKDSDVSFANCGLPYYIGGEIAERKKLVVASAEFLARRFRLDVRTQQEAIQIDRSAKSILVMNRRTGEQYKLAYDKLILSPGAAPLVPPIPGVQAANVFTLRNLADTDRIKQAVTVARLPGDETNLERAEVAGADVERAASGPPSSGSPLRAVVIGAGFIGLEMAEQLQRIGLATTLAELQPQVLPLLDPEMARPIEDELRANGVRVVLGDGIQKIELNELGLATGVVLASGTILPADVVILGIGVRPNTQLASAAGLDLGRGGGITVNAHLQTNDPDIYAVGDAVEYQYGPTGTPLRVALAGPANRAGRLAGEHAASGKSAPMGPVFGTSIVRVFNKTAALTGLTTGLAKRLQLEAASVTITANQHAGYFPHATPLTLKLTFDPTTGKVLGAQAVGNDGVDKRIDVIATAMLFGATVHDLAQLDLAYAPPFGSAKDPVHMAAFAASNQLHGSESFLPADTDLAGLQVVDVRTASEVQSQPLAGVSDVIHIPIDELRDRITELDPQRPTVVSCASGVRAHIGLSILRQHGFRQVQNLSGGAIVRNRTRR